MKTTSISILAAMFMIGCAGMRPNSTGTVPVAVQSQFKSSPMYGSTAVCKRTVTFDEFAQRKSAGEIVESVVHEGFVYFLTEEVWGETLPNGNHVDGVMVDGVFKSKLK
jgi:hypothetical protein